MKCIQADFRSTSVLSLEDLISEKELILGNNVCEKHMVATRKYTYKNTDSDRLHKPSE